MSYRCANCGVSTQPKRPCNIRHEFKKRTYVHHKGHSVGKEAVREIKLCDRCVRIFDSKERGR